MKNNPSAVTVCAWLAIVITGCTTTDSSRSVSAPVVPDSIKVPASDQLSFALNAKGVQIYECRASKDDSTKYEWVLKAPEADLFDARGKKVGRHYGGPTWESIDGSKVIGDIKAREPSTDANAIPWLLLAVKKHEGNGVFSRVSRIQRLETVGGKAPAGGCDQSCMDRSCECPTPPSIISTALSHDDVRLRVTRRNYAPTTREQLPRITNPVRG